MVIKDFLDLNQEGFYKWDVVEALPEFECMKGCEQSPEWHSEGDVWEHTKKVCEQAVNAVVLEGDKLLDEEKELLLISALFHDIGKPATTNVGKDGKIHSYGHEHEGEKLARIIFWDEDIKKREKICALIKWHMDILDVFNHKNYLERIVEIAREVGNFKILLVLKACDLKGSITKNPGRTKDYLILSALQRTYDVLGSYSPELYIPLYSDLDFYIDRFLPNIYVMIGLPGAGKTTYIKEIIEKKEIKDYSIISRDLIRVKLGQCKEGEKYLGTPEEEEAVTEEFNRELMAAVKKGSTIFLDNMNTRRKYRDVYKSLLKGYKFRWVYVYVQAPNIDDNIERRKGQIPEESFKPMISRFEWPSASEYNELIIKITDDNGKV